VQPIEHSFSDTKSVLQPSATTYKDKRTANSDLSWVFSGSRHFEKHLVQRQIVPNGILYITETTIYNLATAVTALLYKPDRPIVRAGDA